MDLPRNSFRCSEPWWRELFLALSGVGMTLVFVTQARSGDDDRVAGIFAVGAIVTGVMTVVFSVVAVRRWLRPYDVTLDETSVHVPAMWLIRPAETIDYKSINDIKREGSWAPRLTVIHTRGQTPIMGSRARRREFDALYDELGARVRQACAEEAVT